MSLKNSLVKIINSMNTDSLNFPFHKYPELSNLTVIQAQYLEVICETKNPTVSKLAESFHVTKPTASIIIDKLAQRGYIQKKKSKLDDRVYFLTLTARGKKLYKIYKTHDDNSNLIIIKKIQKHLTKDDVNRLSEILDRLAKVL